MESTRSRGYKGPLLSVVVSPFVKSISIIGKGSAFLLQYHHETRSFYSAFVGKGREERLVDEDVVRAGRILAKLMSLIGKATRSRYYSFTGQVQVEERRIVYRPYVSPTTTARIYIEGNKIAADVGDVFRKKIRTRVDVEKALRAILSRLDDEARLADR